MERVWVGRISLARVQVEHGRQGRAGSAGLAEVILRFLSFWCAGEKWIKGEICWELFFPPLCLTEERSVLSREAGMETYSTTGKSGRKDLNQLRRRKYLWSEVHGKVLRGERLLGRGISWELEREEGVRDLPINCSPVMRWACRELQREWCSSWGVIGTPIEKSGLCKDKKSYIPKDEGCGVEGEKKDCIHWNCCDSSLCFGGRNLEAEGDLEVEIAEGAGTALEDITAVSRLGSPGVFLRRIVVLLLCSAALEATLKA